MINFLATSREFGLPDGRIYTVKRLALGHYYLLIGTVLIYKAAMEVASGIKKKTKMTEYIKYLKDNALEFAKVQVEWDNIISRLSDFVEGVDVRRLGMDEALTVLNAVIEFNTVKVSCKNGKQMGLTDLSDQFESMVSQLSFLLGKEPAWIYNNLNNYQATVLAQEHQRMRVQTMNDLRFAQNANREEYAKYTGSLMGHKVITGEEIFKNPHLLDEVH